MDALLDAAHSAFLEYGVKRTSMGEIATRAGISPATLYRRYGQKADVVQAVGMREVSRVLAEVDQHIDRSAPGPEQVVELLSSALIALSQNPLMTRVMHTDADVVLPLLTTSGEAAVQLGREYVGALLTGLQASGDLPDFDAGLVAEMATRLAISHVLLPSSYFPADDPERTVAHVRTIVTAMVASS